MAQESPNPAAAAFSLPNPFGPYRVVRRLGRGGMGVVYLAEDTRLGRPVALKVCSVSASDGPALERFRREARSAAALRHRNICPVYEFDVRDGIPYLAMAYIEGPTLAEWMAPRVPLEQRTAAALVARLAAGMQAAHARGVVHRDLKPGNVLMEKGEPVIVDFGLARQAGGQAQLTNKGAVLGTPTYMAPEQAAGESVIGAATDVYALGVILYELLTARPPFDGPAGVVLAQILYGTTAPPRSHRPDLDPRLEAVCLKAMARAPGDRFASMNELARALAAFARGAPAAPPPAPQQAAKAAPPDAAGPGWWATPKPAADTVANQPLTQPTTPPRKPRRSGDRPVGVSGLHVLLVFVCLAALGTVVSLPWWKDLFSGSPGRSEGEKRPVEKPPPDKPDDGDNPSGEPAPELTNSLDMRLVLIRPGSFRMGSLPDDTDRFQNEFAHPVRITRPFYLGTFEVTQAQFEHVMGKGRNPSFFTKEKGGGPNNPVESVTWEEAVEFCKRLSESPEEKKHHRVYRLPTEAEWEYAARAGSTGPYSFSGGAGRLVAHAWFKDDAARKTHPVGGKLANAWGLHDIHGNVAEWCADWFDEKYYEHGPENDPECKTPSDGRVARGGSWSHNARNCRCPNRGSAKPDARFDNIGFRVAVTVGDGK
jgi:formylglycine-generating enzyme required for sulfatase activity/predicted Ser/Thr protein kinase